MRFAIFAVLALGLGAGCSQESAFKGDGGAKGGGVRRGGADAEPEPSAASAADGKASDEGAKPTPEAPELIVDAEPIPIPDFAPPPPGAPGTTVDGIRRISCYNRRFYSDPTPSDASLHYDLPFIAADCEGGVLPPADFLGYFHHRGVCGIGDNFKIIPTVAGAAPYVSLDFQGHCPPNHRTESYLGVVFIATDSARRVGESLATSEAQLLERVTARTGSIACNVTNFEPAGKPIDPYTVVLDAGHCGGKVPDASYFGLLVGPQRTNCGRVLSFQVIQAEADRAAALTFWIASTCDQPGQGSEMRVLFIKKA